MGKCLSCCHPNNTPSTVNRSNQKQAELAAAAVKTDPRSKGANENASAVVAAGGNSRACERTATTMMTTSSFDSQSNNSTKSGGSGVLSDHHKSATSCNSRIPSVRSGSNGSDRRCSRSVSENKINHLFEHYKDPHEDAILSDGIERLCRDLEVRPEEFIVLVLAWKFGAGQMCRFTHEEFVEGCKSLKVDSVQGIRHRFPEMLAEVRDAEHFKDLYRFTYKFGLEEGQRILPAEMAVQLWRLVFSLDQPPILPRWLCFLEMHPHIRGIPRDTWNMFLNFCETVGDDLSIYDDTEAWPSLFDDFVEYENDQTNQNIHPAKNKDA